MENEEIKGREEKRRLEDIKESQIRELKELLEQERKGGSTTVNTDRKREWLRWAEEGRERDREREEERKGQKMHCSTR